MHRIARLLAIAILIGVPACKTTTINGRLAAHTAFRRPEAGLTPAQEAQVTRNCGDFGMPKTDPSVAFGPTHLVVRQGYVLQHANIDKIALWVCEHLSKEQLSGSAERRDQFRPDPLLPAGQRAELADYKGSGFDRGHQAPAGDQASDQTLNDETFFLSNMAPQNPSNNRGIWAGLEDLVRDWVKDGKLEVAYIITGGMFYDPKEDDPDTADGIVNFTQIGADKVSVPTHFYKIVLAKPADGEWQAIAFVIENKNLPKPASYSGFIKSIDWIEERTGLDFFPDLDPAQENALEKPAATMWFE